ncbi:MAG: methyltransferase domain-containing protein [Phycisphaerales bacterium]|nr:MAG: methyltransferase domain-containing protein [Phycisphaerales bacterium]
MSTSAERKTFYDHFSQDKPTKLGMWLVGAVSERIFQFAQIGTGHSVLEIGPGRGAFAGICLEKGVEYWAVEPNEEMADHLRRRGVNVISSIVFSLPEIGRIFDVVVMNSVIEHMDTMMAALELTKQVYGLLNPGGKFVMYAPDYANWRHHFFVGDFSHSYITSWRRLEELLISGGFEDIQGCYQSAAFRGVLCFLISGIAAWLPFAWLDVAFPRSRVARKLYKVQIAFLRRVLILGAKKGEAVEDRA